MKPERIPESWIWASIKDLADLVSGQHIKTSDYVDYPTGIPYLTGPADFGKIYPSISKWTEMPKALASHGDVLITVKGAGVGKVNILEIPEAAISRQLMAIRGHAVDSRYLYYYIKANFDTFQKLGAGSTVPGIDRKTILGFEIPVAPLNEQRRIVAKIEELFSDLDAGVAQLKQVQQQLKRYRQSVLKAAVEGKLTAAWRAQHGHEVEPAEQLLVRILEERRVKWEAEELAKYEAKGKKPPKGWQDKYKEPEPPDTSDLPELPAGWVWANLDFVLAEINAGKSFRCLERPPEEEEVGIVKVSAVSWGEFQEDESKTCTDPDKINPSYFIEEGDFLISRANTIELVGACVIVGSIKKTLMLSDKILRLRFQAINPEWLLYTLRSQHGRLQIESLSTGNQESMRNIGQDRIRSIAIPIPPLAEQLQIMEVLSLLFSVQEQSKSVVDSEIIRAERLRQSILKRAFEGKLVDQDSSDESSLFLLSEVGQIRKKAVARQLQKIEKGQISLDL